MMEMQQGSQAPSATSATICPSHKVSNSKLAFGSLACCSNSDCIVQKHKQYPGTICRQEAAISELQIYENLPNGELGVKEEVPTDDEVNTAWTTL